ncbi:MAG: DUF4268 domain-containing protein [Chloroflexi bacterium]|nr:MAG: DUF4268 domain-containing protein [Chloroflexota bacterium]
MTTTVQEFIKDKLPVETVTLDDSIKTAVKRMIENDFTQLPVVDSNNCPIGIITSDSVLKALHNYATSIEGVRIKHALLTKPQQVNQNIDLLDLFEDMTGNLALVVDDEDKLIQIITDYDTAQYFQQRAKDIILVENIENTLKDYTQLAFSSSPEGEARLTELIQGNTSASFGIRRKFKKGLKEYLSSVCLPFDDDLFDEVFNTQLFVEAVKSYLNALPEESVSFNDELFNQTYEKHIVDRRPPVSFDDLTLGQYISLFLFREHWSQYENIFELEKKSLQNLLDNVRETRNALSHFREITRDQSVQLRDCYDLLVSHQAAIYDVFAPDDSIADEILDIEEEQEPAPDQEIQPIADEPAPGESKYAALAIWLQNQPIEKKIVKPTFSKIEEIIGGKLPASAYKNRSWWANDSVGHVQSKQWLDVGWRVASVNMTNQVARFARIQERQRAYIDFYSALINELREKPLFSHLHTPRPDGANWYWTKNFGVQGRHLGSSNYSFGRGGIFRVEFYIDFGDKELNKQFFDKLKEQKEEIETALGHELLWQRLDSKRACRISRIYKARITDSEEDLTALRKDAVPTMVKFVQIMLPIVEAIGKEIL